MPKFIEYYDYRNHKEFSSNCEVKESKKKLLKNNFSELRRELEKEEEK